MKYIRSLFAITESIRSRVRLNPYVFAALALGIGLLGEFLLNTFLKQDVYLLLTISVFLSAWYGGFLPGAVATLIGYIFADYFFIAPKFVILLTPPEWISAIVFVIEGLLFSLASESRRIKEEERDKAYLAEQKARVIAEDFISIASHELKSPITAQKAYIQMLQILLTKKTSKEYKKYVDKIGSQTNRITSLVDDLLDIAKLQSGRLEFNFVPFDINTCLEEVVEESRVTGSNHAINIRGHSKHLVYGDVERISQVFTNLLSNAIKYSPGAKKVLVRVSDPKDKVIISVKDYGIGISKEDQSRLFSKYFRSEGKSETRFKGFGMGLFIVSEIIKQHNGKIWVESAPGKGSTFYVELPVAEYSSEKKE